MGFYEGCIRIYEPAFFCTDFEVSSLLQVLRSCHTIRSDSSHEIPHVNQSKPNLSQHNARNLCCAILCAAKHCTASQQQWSSS
jgi:hypothetical protein